jgi:hypothetical protein
MTDSILCWWSIRAMILLFSLTPYWQGSVMEIHTRKAETVLNSCRCRKTPLYISTSNMDTNKINFQSQDRSVKGRVYCSPMISWLDWLDSWLATTWWTDLSWHRSGCEMYNGYVQWFHFILWGRWYSHCEVDLFSCVG